MKMMLGDVEPEWENIPEGDRTEGATLCAACLWALMYPPVRMYVIARGVTFPVTDEPGGSAGIPAGPRLIRAARQMKDRGFRIQLDNTEAGIYAATTFRGDALCAPHLYLVAPSYPFAR